MKGFINLIKPEGMSSAYAVGAVKKKFHIPCGHMGTLDPMASGVLPVGIGKTSRLFQYMLSKEKTYIAEFEFGYLTDTLDKTGLITNTTEVLPNKDQIISALSGFVGEISQMPPKYSAKCIDGKRGYELARKGVEFELEPKVVEVLSYDFIEQTGENAYKFKITCKGGTYVRSLCRDLGFAVGSLATMTSLCRSNSGIFSLENGVSIEEFKNSDNPEKYLIAPDLAIDFPKLVLSDKEANRVLNGVFDNKGYESGLYRVYNQSEFWGVGEAQNGVLKIKAYVR